MPETDERPLHQCRDCGFLTMRNDFSGQLEEVDQQFRLTGDPPRISKWEFSEGTGMEYRRPVTPFRHVPICFAAEYVLIADVIPGADDPYDAGLSPALVKEIIQKDRPCGAFTKWQLGHTPKEHREMVDRELLRKWQAGREDADQAFRLEMQQAQLEAQDKIDERRFTAEQGFGWRLAKFGAAIAIVAALLGAAVSAGTSAVLQKNPTVINEGPVVNVPSSNPVITVVVPTPESP